MAVDGVKRFRSRKRKRGSKKRKILANERVEVRSVEEGFLGSWNPGTVIHCGKQKRHVRYDNVLDEDGSNYLVDVVFVSPVLDGTIGSSNYHHQRGFIRPLPPLIEFGAFDLQFGLCVDVCYQEAWWEGVIFDHCNGMEERSIFFPDLGDEMKIGIHQLRITQDWDEVSQNWNRRGNWVFLELVEECEKASFVAVSVKQIWYDVRAKKEFDKNIRDWTFNVKDSWRDLVMEVVNDYYNLTLQEVFQVLDFTRGLLNETTELASVEPNANNACGSGIETPDSPIEKDDLSNFLDIDQNFGSIIPNQEKNDVCPVHEALTEFQKQISFYEAGKVTSGTSCCEKNRQHKQSNHSKNINWEPLMLSEVEFCPDVVDQYTLGSESKTTREFLKTKVRKHVAYLGWRIEWTEDNNNYPGRLRYRYKSPDTQGQKVYNSLLKVCKHIQNDSGMNDQSNISHLLHDRSQKSDDIDVCHPIVQPSPFVKDVIEPEFCPQAVVKYYLHGLEKHWADKKEWKLKARKHLLAEGWIFQYPTKKRSCVLCKSPQNGSSVSLRGACRQYLKESIPKWTTSGKRPLNVSIINKEIVDQVDSDDLSQIVSQLLQKEPEFHTIDYVPASRSTQKCLRNSEANKLKHQRNGSPIQVLRSNKRVQKVSAPCLSHQKPQNVLSWLIDNNMVQPRSKVYYWEKGVHAPVAEGRIVRDGIKCSCCKKVYSLGGFVNHASGRSSCRPAASVFLVDGRSLLDCQIQVMNDHRTREAMEKPCNDLCQGENDNICSVCHYGGELILCDQCPSAFHRSCLDLEDIPDGDWFCPSCRCGICGQVKSEGADDGHVLTCIQCEHKYHVSCLRNRAIDKSRRYMENWFCGKECEKVYAGLQKLLGQPVPVGVNNLTWTLVKCVNSESCDVGSAKIDFLAEIYSKLSVALSVMHECFEPLNEASSSRDLMEDVLFSRWSELNRLNFKGFYTVLLERNEELISVATVRIYGEKVAEVPLVGTRFQYRRLGMCRILMDELEKKLMQLGVERLVLPAVPGVLETWTGSFGFMEMTNFERSQFLDYSFLDFQDTIMCQKLLKEIPSPNSVLSQGNTDHLGKFCR